MIDARSILRYYYPGDTELRRLLFRHSSQVADKALQLASTAHGRTLGLNLELLETGGLLHDIGIGLCHAPTILCVGKAPYLAHGLIGGELLRRYGAEHGLDLEAQARICERHTGSGITAEEVVAEGLPLPVRDYMPETLEEKLICYADKFFSKSGDGKEKSYERARGSLARFGAAPLARFEDMRQLFEP